MIALDPRNVPESPTELPSSIRGASAPSSRYGCNVELVKALLLQSLVGESQCMQGKTLPCRHPEATRTC